MIRFVAVSIAAFYCSGAIPFLHAAESAAVGRTIVRNISGNLTIDEAVKIALRQNPEVLKALQEIERTKGQVIEVRAQALPQVTLTGTYNQQDRNLIEGSSQSGNNGNAVQLND